MKSDSTAILWLCSISIHRSSTRIGRQRTHLCAKRSPSKKGFLWKLVEFLHKLWQLISGIINFSHYNNSISSNLHNNLGDFKYFHQKSNARSEDKSFVGNVLPLPPTQGATQHWIYWHCRCWWWWVVQVGRLLVTEILHSPADKDQI